ncbi:MAG: DUF4197 domain-containing protein [Bacteroidetes bacterium]|nr:DUF4197 domain-containing protein [Bacteroidota bacterium]
MKKIILLIFLSALILSSCEETEEILQNTGLSNEEIVLGLKQALTVATDTSVSIVSKVDGYYMDPVIKILLPPEADIIVENINNPLLSGLGLDLLVEDVILKINRAAEEAAKDAVPIFLDAITGMTITDAYNILHGNDTAATHYLRESTYLALFGLYEPVLQASLDKPIIGNVSAQSTWNTLTDEYNAIANTMIGQLAGLQPVNTDLGEYVTHKGLDGLFVKIADEEAEIRHNLSDRVTDLLRRVFGSLGK